MPFGCAGRLARVAGGNRLTALALRRLKVGVWLLSEVFLLPQDETAGPDSGHRPRGRRRAAGATLVTLYGPSASIYEVGWFAPEEG